MLMGRGEDKQTCREEECVERSERGSHKLGNAQSLRVLGRHMEDSSRETWESTALPTPGFWTSGFQDCVREKKKSLLCESSQFVHQVVAFCYRGCQKLIHTVPSLFEMVGRRSEEYFCLRARPYWLLLFLIFPPVCAQGSALPPAWGFVEPLGAPFGFLLTQNHSNLHQAADLPSQEGENYFQ